jgi:tRNA(fMet)-specific endonuclease VapC
VNYLLDTNACIALINGKPASVRSRFQKAVSAGSQVFVSSVAAFELWYGVAKSTRPEFTQQRVGTFFAGPISQLDFDGEDAKIAGAIRATLEASGRPIGAFDTLIAGQAVQRRLTLVTANISEFSRVDGLQWQDWAKS